MSTSVAQLVQQHTQIAHCTAHCTHAQGVGLSAPRQHALGGADVRPLLHAGLQHAPCPSPRPRTGRRAGAGAWSLSARAATLVGRIFHLQAGGVEEHERHVGARYADGLEARQEDGVQRLAAGLFVRVLGGVLQVGGAAISAHSATTTTGHNAVSERPLPLRLWVRVCLL